MAGPFLWKLDGPHATPTDARSANSREQKRPASKLAFGVLTASANLELDELAMPDHATTAPFIIPTRSSMAEINL
jgi:hypothetical protein